MGKSKAAESQTVEKVDDNSSLTPQQDRFCLEYMKDLNATRACIRAGYSEATAPQQGSRLLSYVKVQQRIAELVEKRAKRTQITADRILQELSYIGLSDLSGAFDEKGNLINIKDMPKSLRRAISGIDQHEEYSGLGNNRMLMGYTKKVRTWDKLKALELLGKHLKMFTDKVELTGKDGENLFQSLTQVFKNVVDGKGKP